MRKIQVLSQAVADQIAAGEVAERPSAVVKELVENAIDAGATQIDVEIKQGGISYIRVTDNGCGIPFDQLETAFLRHATSKLSTIDDLEQIATMGFRGEALASICAVAEVEVITKTPDSDEGTYLELIHGIPSEKEPIACADGTTMVVKRLFANIPARMKFLKKNSSEAGYVSDLIGRIALSRPEIAFTYTCDDKEIFSTSGDGKLENVVLKLYGLDHAKGVIPIDYTEDNIRVRGLIGKPELARGNRSRQTLFVNGRYIKNHIISKVAEEAYRNTIMVGRFPFFVIEITLPPELVDVNVHPAKTEIKFANEKQIYDVAYHAIRSSIYKAEEKPEEKPAPVIRAYEKPVSSTPVFTNEHKEDKPDTAVIRQFMDYTIPEKKVEIPPEIPEVKVEQKHFAEPTLDEIIDFSTKTAEPVQEEMAEFTETVNYVEKTKIIGQVFDTYIVCQKGEEMYLIDQHAAHERLRFEELKEQYLKGERLSQLLLTPIVLNLEFNEKQIVLENLANFKTFGFEIEDFGGNSVIVHSTPIQADEKVISELILEMADSLAEQRKHPVADFEERALDMISCKYAIKANHKLSAIELQDLVDRVENMEQTGVKTCPHGRPVRITFAKNDIEKLFKRI